MLDISKFYVLTVISNPVRYKSRWRLYKEFANHIAEVGGTLITVEQTFGDREFQITERDNPHHLQVRTEHELWHKENMINLGVQYLSQVDPDWKYVAWIDADVSFQRKDIILETAQQLQHYYVVQMFGHVVDMGPNLEFIQQHAGFVWMYHQNRCFPPQKAGEGGYYADAPSHAFWHPGYAWAANREFFNRIQLFDKAILGAGDHHMALSLIGQGYRSMPNGISPAYRKAVLDWEKEATYAFKRDVGYVPGLLTHHWHGKKRNRNYIGRWQIITQNTFDPVADLGRDAFGLYKLNLCHGERSIRLRDDIRMYFRSRNEDSIDIQ